MDRVLGRVKNIFKKNPRPTLPPGSFPYNSGNEEALGTITKPPYPGDDDDDEEIESLRNYNIPEQTRLRGQRENTFQPENTTQNRNSFENNSAVPSGRFNPPNAPFRGASSGFATNLPMNNNSNNNNMNPSSNNNTGATPNLPSRPNLPFLSQIQDPSSQPVPNLNSTPTNTAQPSFGGFPPGMNQNQSAQPPSGNLQQSFGGFPPGLNQNPSVPPPPNNPQSSFGGFSPGLNQTPSVPPPPNNPQSSFGGFPPGMNLNQTQSPSNNSQAPSSAVSPGTNTNQMSSPPIATNPQSTSAGLPSGMNPQSVPSTKIPRMNAQQGSSTDPMKSVRNQTNDDDDNVSRLELDYPIENVLIDANIPSTMAIKINEVVEQDRLGQAYHIHRYTFEPSAPQQISFGNNQHISRHSVQNPYHGGTRHIREIHNDHQNSSIDNMDYPPRSHKHYRRRYQPDSETSLNQYIDQLLHTPGSIVIQAHNSNDLHHILNQHLSNNHINPTSSSIYPFQSNTNTLTEPVFHYTARALPNDPMRPY